MKVVFTKVLDHFRVGGDECEPVEYGGDLYVIMSGDIIYAFNALSGVQLWSFAPSLSDAPGWAAETSRGVAVSGSNVYMLSADDYLYVLNRFNGQVLNKVSIAPVSAGYSESMAPLVVGSDVIIGSSGGDEGTRGFLEAVSTKTWSIVWTWYSVPPPGSSWNQPPNGNHGGGSIWTTPIYANGKIFAGTGNPSPDFYGNSRPGNDPHTDSVNALTLNSGTLQWSGQEVAHDLWDSDAASPPIVFQSGQNIDIGEAGKDGYFYEFNSNNGKEVVKPIAFVKQDRVVPTLSGVLEWPGSEGGANYGLSTYDPQTQEAYVSGMNFPTIVKSSPTMPPSANPLQDHEDAGSTSVAESGVVPTGTISAINVNGGNIVWQRIFNSPAIGGITSTSSNLLFFGLEDGSFYVLNALNGKTEFTSNLNAPIGMAPVEYQIGNKEYVAVMTGGAESLKYQFPYQGAYSLTVFSVSN